MYRSILVSGFCVACALQTSNASAETRYAKNGGLASGDCNGSWANACTLGQAWAKANAGDEIWVVEGTYAGIALKDGVKIIGGFAGTETSASQSDPTAHPTILNGGGTGPVVTCENNTPGTTMLRGFRITNGHGAADLTADIAGGGMWLLNSGAVIVQCVFDHNTALYTGAAVAIRGGQPWFVNCEFHDNGSGDGETTAPWAGGAVFVHSGSPTFMNCLFNRNKAMEGGAIQVYNGNPTIVNSTFVNNRAGNGYGGAISDEWLKSTIRNCIFWGNTARKGATQIFIAPEAVGDVTYSDIQGGWTGSTNINADPLFVNATNDNYRLDTSSPCINAGRAVAPALPADQGDLNWNGNLGEPTPLDLGLLARRVNIKVDLGPYERPADGSGSMYQQ
jgi:hypothetical protein